MGRVGHLLSATTVFCVAVLLASMASAQSDPSSEGDPCARAFKVVYGAIATDDKEIAILSRSMLQIIIDLASCIAVPEGHVAEKRTPATFKDEPVNGVTIAPQKPTDAFVSIR